MGNIACLERLDDTFCGPRAQKFLAPNEKEAFYIFDNVEHNELWEGATSSAMAHGYPLNHRWENICHCDSSQLCISGRLACSPVLPRSPGTTVFRLCSRGIQSGEATSGVHFTLKLEAVGRGVMLCPSITLVLKNSQEVILVGDNLGPVPLQDFLVDFAAVDQGRNLQLDIILRGLPAREGKTGIAKAYGKTHDWTLRTRLQEFTCFNDLGRKQLYLAGPLDGCQVLLQNLVASEEEIRRAPPMTPAWIQLKQASEQGVVGPILFEGSETGPPDRVPLAEPMEHRDFWHHMVFDMAHGRASPSGGLETTQGEFWMSKRAMNMHPVYLYCKLTVAQALVSCISFRFSCQMDYLDMLQNTPTAVQFKYPHIPSRGVIMGVEKDPRHPQLIRMFIEYRNEILEDMILCEVNPEQADKIVVHQEIYDTIGMLRYRVVVEHPDGPLLGELKMKNQRLQEIDHAPARSLQLYEEPSWRFPIAPMASRMAPSTGSRLFLYTGIPYKQTAAPSPEQSEPGLLQKPPKDPVWTQPLVESVAVVGDLYFSESHWVS